MLLRYLLIAMIFLTPQTVFAQANAKIVDPDPEIERKTFILPEGFEVNLFASDPLLAKPIQMNFDPQGRLWVACSEIYPHIKPGEKANDKILILEDTKGEGKADKVTVFADGLLIPTGVEPGDGGAYVANSTELLHLSASKPGGKADKTRVVLSGFGTEDTHHILHTLRWGPDGALYFNQSIYIHSHIETPHGVKRLNGGGIWRYRPETEQLDVFVRGFINTWGHHIDRFGQSFITDGANGEGITHGIPGAAYPTAVGFNRILHGMNPGSPKHCGLEILSGSHLPEDWRGNLLTCDFRGHRVCRFVLKDDGSTYASQEKTELIKSNHPAFRPIDIKMGPDGGIYIADWYNPIIQHGEVDFRDPRRDHTHGRIWRVTAKGRPLVTKPDFNYDSVVGLIRHLASPDDWTRHNARRMLKERGAKTVAPVLTQWVNKLDPALPDTESQMLEALWTFQALGEVNVDLLKKLLNAQDARIRAAAVRVLINWLPHLKDAESLLQKRVADEHPRVRLEAIRALASLKCLAAAELALSALSKPMDRTLDYALWLTTKELEPYWMPKLQAGEDPFNGNIKAMIFALEAAGTKDVVKPLLKIARNDSLPVERRKQLWLLLAKICGANEITEVLQDGYFADPTHTTELLLNLEANVRQMKYNGTPKIETTTLYDFMHAKGTPTAPPALRLVGLLKQEELRVHLEARAKSKDAIETEKAAALEGLNHLGGPKSIAFISGLAGKDNPADTRRLAIAALSELDANAAARHAIELLTTSKPTDDVTLVYKALLDRKGGASILTKELANKKLAPDVAKQGLRALRASTQDAPALVESLNKAGDLATQKRELTKIELDTLVAEVISKGDATSGEKLYRRADLQCLNCHGIGGSGGQVGPDLASIGASAQVDYLVESLLIPTKAVKEGFHSLRIETLDGKVYTGVKLRESKSDIALRLADDKEIIIPLKDIEDKRESRSLMPDGLVDTLTRGELIDMVKFLSELGKVGPYSLSKTRVVRRWQVLKPTPDALGVIRKARVAAAAEPDPAFNWSSVYTLVSGELPLDTATSFSVWRDTPALGVYRFTLDVTTAGKVKLKFNSAEGISLFVGSTAVDASDETIIDLPAGMQHLMIAVDLTKRKAPLRVEVEDVEKSPARVTIVGGK